MCSSRTGTELGAQDPDSTCTFPIASQCALAAEFPQHATPFHPSRPWDGLHPCPPGKSYPSSKSQLIALSSEAFSFAGPTPLVSPAEPLSPCSRGFLPVLCLSPRLLCEQPEDRVCLIYLWFSRFWGGPHLIAGPAGGRNGGEPDTTSDT